MALEIIRTIDFRHPDGGEAIIEVHTHDFESDRLTSAVTVGREDEIGGILLHDAEHMRRVIRAMVVAGKRLGWDIEIDELG